MATDDTNKEADTDCWLRPSEVAEFFHVSPITVRSWAKSGVLEARVTPGGHRRFLLSEVKRLANSQLGAAPDHSEKEPTVLIVDDDVAVAGLLEAHLRRHFGEMAIYHACDGFEAGALAQESVPDLIFLDIMMPGIRGDAVCRFIRRKEALNHIPIVGISGYASVDNIEKMKTAGALTVLEKPFDMEKLLELTGQILNINGVDHES